MKVINVVTGSNAANNNFLLKGSLYDELTEEEKNNNILVRNAMINSLENEQLISVAFLRKNNFSGETIIIPLTYYGVMENIVACQLATFSIENFMVFIFSINGMAHLQYCNKANNYDSSSIHK